MYSVSSSCVYVSLQNDTHSNATIVSILRRVSSTCFDVVSNTWITSNCHAAVANDNHWTVAAASIETISAPAHTAQSTCSYVTHSTE